jgi:hypothetical protein
MVDVDKLRAELTPIVDRYIEEHPELVAAYLAGGAPIPAGALSGPEEPDAENVRQAALAKLIAELPQLAEEQGVTVEELAEELREMEKEGLFSEIALEGELS